MPDPTDHLSGDSPIDRGESAEQREADPGVFGEPNPLSGRPGTGDIDFKPTAIQGPGGDSRPDRTEAGDGGFIDVSQHPLMTVGPDRDSIDPIKFDDESLAKTRTDQDDEIVSRYDPDTDGEKAVLQPRITKRGDESENL